MRGAPQSRPRQALWVAGSAVLFGALTALTFVTRAGDATTSNWPVTWELRSSDNGVLFQVMQDVFAGRTLDWSFSPQVYVFPELPISFVAFVTTAGSVYAYYLVVAVINTVLLYLAILATVRVISLPERMSASVARAAVAATPLVLFPLIGTSWIVSFHLAPTYYFGMYLALIAAPLLMLARRGWVRGVVGAALLLTAASNPLLAVFALPGFAIVVIVVALRRGIRRALRTAALPALVLLGAVVVRLAFFTPLQGTSPLTYIDPVVFEQRTAQLWPYFSGVSADPATQVILTVGAGLAVLCLAGAIVTAVRFVRRTRDSDSRMLALVYLGAVPVLGLAGTFALMITHYLYFWPVLVLPFVLVLMVFPREWSVPVVPLAAAALVITAVICGVGSNLAHLDRYFGYRNDETRCLDENLPPGVRVGYSTFSDARRLSLTSQLPFRLIPLRSGGDPSFWLANRDYVRSSAGEFFYVNERGDESAIDESFIVTTFGEPDARFECGEGQSVLIYSSPASHALIGSYYGVQP